VIAFSALLNIGELGCSLGPPIFLGPINALIEIKWAKKFALQILGIVLNLTQVFYKYRGPGIDISLGTPSS